MDEKMVDANEILVMGTMAQQSNNDVPKVNVLTPVCARQTERWQGIGKSPIRLAFP